MTFDLALTETILGNGGDMQITGNDLVTVTGFQNLPYLSMFGGNIEEDTDEQNPKEQDFSWWGNKLLFPGQPDLQMNSLTERTYKKVSLNSQGRLSIEDSTKQDLKPLKDFGTVSVSTSIISDDRIDTIIKIEADIEDPKILIISNKKKSGNGDFFLFDFNDDFFL